jgi:hypothetical protein
MSSFMKRAKSVPLSIEKGWQGLVPSTENATEPSIVNITPEMARAMLETSIGNRRIRPSHVEKLVGAMKRGEWRVTSQGIGFDVSGALRDGHHRLTACVQSGVTIRSLVIEGLDPSAYEVTDTGALRNLGDRLSLDRYCANVYSLAVQIAERTSHPSTDQMRPYLNGRLVSLTEEICGLFGGKAPYFTSAGFRLGAVISVMEGADKRHVFSQYFALCSREFNDMTPISQAISRQVYGLKRENSSTVLVRSLKVFDPQKANIGQVLVHPRDVPKALDRVTAALLDDAIQNGEVAA